MDRRLWMLPRRLRTASLAARTGPSADGEELLGHVPSDWQEQCVDTPSTNAATAVVSCFLQTEGTGAELAIFQQFPTAAPMDDTYRDLVDLFGVESEGDCERGPHETTWSVQDETLGRLQCAPQGVGIRFDWTHDQLLILSSRLRPRGRLREHLRPVGQRRPVLMRGAGLLLVAFVVLGLVGCAAPGPTVTPTATSSPVAITGAPGPPSTVVPTSAVATSSPAPPSATPSSGTSVPAPGQSAGGLTRHRGFRGGDPSLYRHLRRRR